MKTNLFPALKLTLFCILVFVVLYAALVGGAAYVIAPNHGRGEIILKNGKPVGFANVGQAFTKDNYFWSRPSAVNYNAAGSAGSNKGPSNQEYLQTVQARIDTFLIHNPGVKKSEIPVDLVTASGSGLDPHISPQAARIQILRIAKSRNIDNGKLNALVDSFIEKPLLGFIGTERVNVLKLNIALDEMTR
jgi:K+-transporting ATPase ATPase C chain